MYLLFIATCLCLGTLACEPSPCLNNATCRYVGGEEEFTCDCVTGFVGERCQFECKCHIRVTVAWNRGVIAHIKC